MRVVAATIVALALAVPAAAAAQRSTLGPKDGQGFAPVDTGRVIVGSEAPDFTLASLDRGRITLSDFRGRKNVILVFYRGYW